MINKKRLLSILLAVLMVVSVSVGCSKTSDADKPDDKAGNQQVSEDTQGSEGGEETADEIKGPSWTWDTSPVTIDWFINYDWGGYTWDAEKKLVDKLVTEKTGVTVNVITPASGGDEKLNTMIAGGTLPDVVTLDWRAPQIKLMVQGGLLYSINELVEKYAPTMDAILPESLKLAHAYPDGKIYGMPSFYWAPEEMDPEKNFWETNAGMLAREDIMNSLGITKEDFSTQEGTIAALKKVKDQKVQYNGVDVAPIYFGEMGLDALDLTLPAFFAVPMEDEQGNYIDQRTHPKFLEAIKFTNRLYREGLLPKENFTSPRQPIEEKITAGNVFAFIGNVGNYHAAMGNLTRNDPNAKFTVVGPIRSNDGSDPVRIESGMGWTMSCITKNAKHPDRAIRFMEFTYSEEGDLIISYGIKGETYVVNDDGTIELTDELKKMMEEDSEKYWAEYGFAGFNWLTNYVRVQRRTKPIDAFAEMKNGWYREMAKIVYPTTLFEKLGPDPGTDASNKLTEIDTIWSKNVVNMMVAESEADCEKIYNETIEQIKKMGLDEIVSIRNENFQNNKKAAGVKFAWPSYLN